MRNLGLLGSIGLASMIAGCGGSSESCPPDFPIRRGDACFRADGGGIDAATLEDAGGTGDDAGPFDAAACVGSHPLFDATRRWCDPGCYCGDPTASPVLDVCYPAEVAEACCPVDVVCGPPADVDAGVQCEGTHPLFDPGDPSMRYCAPGNCYCGDMSVDPVIDVCYPEAAADSCCPVLVVCY